MEDGASRPIGELVPGISTELNAAFGSGKSDHATANVLAMPLVAAFVDGNISLDDENLVCRASLVDNSVLAEIIAAVRSLQEFETSPPLTSELTSRLLALQAFEHPVLSLEASPTSGDPIRDAILSSFSKNKIRPGVQKRRYPFGLTLFLSLAASILVLFWLGDFLAKPASVAPSHGGKDTDLTVKSELPKQDKLAEGEQTAVHDIANVAHDLQSRSDELQTKEFKDVVDPEKIAGDTNRTNLVIESMNPSASSQQTNQISGFRWTKINGLLAQRFSAMTDEAIWKSVEISNRGWETVEELTPLELRTLPMSRAEATLVSGGKIVIAADTGVQWIQSTSKADGHLDLQYGQVALVEIPKGTSLDLRLNGASLTKIRWESKASLVLGVTAFGVQAQIEGGEISFDNQTRKSTSVIVDRGFVTESSERTGRMPTWVARPVDTFTLPKGVLSQIAASDNLANTLSQLMESELLDETKAALISTWRTSLSGENQFRLAAARRPLVRYAILQRMVQTPEWDARYFAIWSEIGKTIGDERRTLFLQNMAHMARQGRRPNPSQLNALITLLESPDTGIRSLGDFLLRHFHKGGPVFDPTWTGEANARGVGLWRRFVAQTVSSVR